jgi:hypothetical protein
VKIEPKVPASTPPGTYFWGVTITGVTNEVEFGNNAVSGGSVFVKAKN